MGWATLQAENSEKRPQCLPSRSSQSVMGELEPTAGRARSWERKEPRAFRQPGLKETRLWSYYFNISIDA